MFYPGITTEMTFHVTGSFSSAVKPAWLALGDSPFQTEWIDKQPLSQVGDLSMLTL
jgi:hypothetical protein